MLPQPAPAGRPADDLAFPLDISVGERDTSPLGFSGNVVFRKQYSLRVAPDPQGRWAVYVHTGERHPTADTTPGGRERAAGPEILRTVPDPASPGTFTFPADGPGFTAAPAPTVPPA